MGQTKRKLILFKKKKKRERERKKPKLQDPSQGSLPGTQHCVHMHMFLSGGPGACRDVGKGKLSWGSPFRWGVKGCAVLYLVAQSCLTLCNPRDCTSPGSSVHGDSPGKNTRVDCHAFFQGIFPTQRSKPRLLHYRQILYRLSHQGSP